MGRYLKSGIEELRASRPEYKNVLTDIRGRGLMIGIEFCGKRAAYGNSLFGVLAEQKLLVGSP